MYTPLDALPELTEEYRQAEQQAVLNASVLYEFELAKESPHDYGNIIIWVLGAIFQLWLGSLLSWPGILVSLVLISAIGSYLYYAGNPDVKQTVTLTKKGLIVTELTLVPDACYTALRYSGYAGIAISVVGVALVGPMMFVGAGAGLLMSFKMAGIVNKPRVNVFPFHHALNYEVNNALAVKYKHGLIQRHISPMIEIEHDGSVREKLFIEQLNFYYMCYAASPEQQSELLTHLKKVITISE
ncbi:hypothetical protein [uncultured Photobacterium sp.]|uniref:hypothetical protein n=1 Tax=uncultured Photobacterium sp. TaxID=173973 RepID=UPI002608C983|nr:hypothetical protein [uncultured Photobacterium sp.]